MSALTIKVNRQANICARNTARFELFLTWPTTMLNMPFPARDVDDDPTKIHAQQGDDQVNDKADNSSDESDREDNSNN